MTKSMEDRILDFIKAEPLPVTFRNICAGIHRSSHHTYHFIRELEKAGKVVKVKEQYKRNRYKINV